MNENTNTPDAPPAHTDASALLEMFIAAYNTQTENDDSLIEELAAKVEAQNATIQLQSDHIAQLSKKIAELNQENQRLIEIENKAKQLVAASEKIKQDFDAQKGRMAMLQQKVDQWKGENDPKRLNHRVKRLTESNGKLTIRVERLQKERANLVASVNTQIKDANNRLLRYSLPLVFEHKGEALFLMPKDFSVNVEEGEGMMIPKHTLLYFNNHGQAKLVTYNQEHGAMFAKAPPGGTKISSIVREYASDWLVKSERDGLQLKDLVPASSIRKAPQIKAVVETRR